MALRALGLLATGLLPAVVIAAPAEFAQHVLQTRPETVQQTEQAPASPQRKLHGRFLHLTDFHPDPYYKTHSSTEESIACHHGTGPAGAYGAETSDCDSPFSLANATFNWITANLKDSIDFIIWTGDSARHDSDDKIPRTEKEVLASNRMLAESFVSHLSDSNGLSIPVIPTFGNNDILPHNIMVGGPNKWLKSYAEIWRAFIPEAQRHTFELGGWFFSEVIPNHLAVFSLNTLYFFDRNAGIDDCVHPSEPGFKQLEWLRVQLQFLRDRGMKAILMGHVPPARTSGKQNWDETCWQKYTLWLQQYRDVIVGSLYGHMNIDHFILQDTKDIDVSYFEEGALEYAEHVQRSIRKRSQGNLLSTIHDDLTIKSSADYLIDLRDDWAKLPKAAVRNTGNVKADAGKKKSIGGEWAERYQLSLVSPSIVPNYFPTLRVYEYNISGLENAETWKGMSEKSLKMMTVGQGNILQTLDLRDIDSSNQDMQPAGKKKKGDKNKKPDDPYLIIPNPPAKTAHPGPAYSPQPLTLTGYTQFFANLTYINNDAGDFVSPDGRLSVDRWNEGVHKGKQPSHKPKPRPFEFEVEYSTMDDKLYKMDDLTVRSYLELAYRIGQETDKAALVASDGAEGETMQQGEYHDDESKDDHDGFEANGRKKKKKKGGKKKSNKVWLHFLRHAFVSTVPQDELKKL
ncbi:Metallo-dependent phosphatase-like protein [Xylariales sp. PMI_506]|nr:Metallo-dependent phosphatase-like protein [Xylariales sp. PMI_506]